MDIVHSDVLVKNNGYIVPVDSRYSSFLKGQCSSYIAIVFVLAIVYSALVIPGKEIICITLLSVTNKKT